MNYGAAKRAVAKITTSILEKEVDEMSIIRKTNMLNFMGDLTIDLCYLLLYRLGGVNMVAMAMLVEWLAYLVKDWIVPIYKQIKLEIKLKRLDKELDELEGDLSEETC